MINQSRTKTFANAMRQKQALGVLLALLLLATLILSSLNGVGTAQAQCAVRTDWGVYRVVGGDTLYRIGRRFDTTVSALVNGNCLVDANRIYIGQQLRVPSVKAGSTTPPGVHQFTTGATFQSFQNGFMVWRADTGEIRVYIGGYMPSGTGELLIFSAGQFGNLPVQGVVAPQGQRARCLSRAPAGDRLDGRSEDKDPI